jgi:hypothetical protein
MNSPASGPVRGSPVIQIDGPAKARQLPPTLNA